MCAVPTLTLPTLFVYFCFSVYTAAEQWEAAAAVALCLLCALFWACFTVSECCFFDDTEFSGIFGEIR